MNDEKQRLKLLKKKTMLFWNEQNSLHLLLYLYLSLFYLKKQQNQNPNRKKTNPTQSSPVKVSIPVPQFQLKETKIRQLPPPLLTSKKLQTNSLDNMRS